MALKFFGEFLVEQGAISDASLAEALALLETVNISIGELAVGAGYMTREDARRVNLMQRDVHAPFGDLAREMGLLTWVQVQELLHHQCESHLYLAEALVRIGAISQDRVTDLFGLYRKDQAGHFGAPHPLPDELREDPFIPQVLQMLPTMALRIAHLQLKMSWPVQWEGLSEDPIQVMFEIASLKRVQLGFATGWDLGADIGSAMLGYKKATGSVAAAPSTIAAFLNTLIRHAKASMERTGGSVDVVSLKEHCVPENGYAIEFRTPSGRGTLFANVYS